MTGIYIHVPFCMRKCPYCDFYSIVYEKDIADAYVSALKRNFGRYKKDTIIIDTIYFGGGTPSLLTSEQILDIISSLRMNFVFAADIEITMEANPSSVDLNKLCEYRNAGVNRISFGVQSACNSELSALGRLHDFEQAKEVVIKANEAGFNNISCDLMIGTPRQTLESLLDSARELARLPINHISAYMLKIEEGTLFDCDWVRSNVAEEDDVCDMYEKLIYTLETAGFKQYEISNFSKINKKSRHNLKYWIGEDYLGFGPAAHSFYKGVRFYVPKDIYEFISNDFQEEIIEEENPCLADEYVMLSLRLNDGINFLKHTQLGGDSENLYQRARVFDGSGLVELSTEGIKLTTKGFLVSNGIISELIN
ncbi:MAG: radical SAM family heme chaperone HemW [Clostridiales bacterium]|nr:radical SAM family heme chaperone HemW [Clostridiales bacterium]